MIMVSLKLSIDSHLNLYKTANYPRLRQIPHYVNLNLLWDSNLIAIIVLFFHYIGHAFVGYIKQVDIRLDQPCLEEICAYIL